MTQYGQRLFPDNYYLSSALTADRKFETSSQACPRPSSNEATSFLPSMRNLITSLSSGITHNL